MHMLYFSTAFRVKNPIETTNIDSYTLFSEIEPRFPGHGTGNRSSVSSKILLRIGARLVTRAGGIEPGTFGCELCGLPKMPQCIGWGFHTSLRSGRRPRPAQRWDIGFWSLDCGLWILDSGSAPCSCGSLKRGRLDFGCRILDFVHGFGFCRRLACNTPTRVGG